MAGAADRDIILDDVTIFRMVMTASTMKPSSCCGCGELLNSTRVAEAAEVPKDEAQNQTAESVVVGLRRAGRRSALRAAEAFQLDAALSRWPPVSCVSAGKRRGTGFSCVRRGNITCRWRAQFPQLVSHQVLGKWLYISQTHGEFESVAMDMARLAHRRDPRLGVESKVRMR